MLIVLDIVPLKCSYFRTWFLEALVALGSVELSGGGPRAVGIAQALSTCLSYTRT